MYGLSLEEIREGIQSLQPVSGRFHIIEGDRYTVIDDCYNANPVSMKASLDVLCDALGRKVAILGDMGELGANEAELHREVGVYAASKDVQALVCIGRLSACMAEAARHAAPTKEVLHFDTKEEFLEHIPEILKDGDTVLVKASHFMEFEQIVKELQK